MDISLEIAAHEDVISMVLGNENRLDGKSAAT